MRPSFVNLLALLTASLMLATCTRDDAPIPSRAAPILAPFEGTWHVNFEKTLDQWKSDGVPASEIAATRAAAAKFPFPIHPDMTLKDSRALVYGPGPFEGAYDFFALHTHGPWICGKAWHHEDRHDPGDMDKYMVRLQKRGNELLFAFRVSEDAAEPSDPDITSMPLLAGSASTCTADALPESAWSSWRTYVFELGRATAK
jgi:hypothetical protein